MNKQPNPVGRPPRETPKVPITIRLEPETAAKFKAICKQQGVSQSKRVEQWVEDET